MNMIYLNDRAADLNTRWNQICEPKLMRLLVDNRIGSVWDMVACTKRDVRSMPGIGNNYAFQIEQNLEQLGLALRREP